MIAGAEIPSRRLLFGMVAGASAVALASPIAALPISTPTGLEIAWQRAMAAYQQAKDAAGQYELTWKRTYEAWATGPDKVGHATNRLQHDLDYVVEQLDTLSEDVLDCETVLMRTPAPDMAALLWKLEILLMVEDGSTTAWSAKFVDEALLDARRLAA